MKQLFVATTTLKSFLSLFKADSILTDLTLGDTWHPADGYVDEQIFDLPVSVADVLDYWYDFRGLVHFTCKVDALSLMFVDQDYHQKRLFCIEGLAHEIRLVEYKLIENNAYTPGQFEYFEQPTYQS